jgi:hypothetical protein
MVLSLRSVFCADLRTGSAFCFILHSVNGFYNWWWKVFTARYRLIPDINQIRLVLKMITCVKLYYTARCEGLAVVLLQQFNWEVH